MKRIGVLASNVNEGLPYQRLHMPFRHLRHDYEFRPFHTDQIGNADAFYLDAVVMCHTWTPMDYAFIERAKQWYGLKVICDIDDLMHNLPSDHPEYRNVMTYQRVAHILQSCDHVTVSTDYLKHAYGHLNSNISVIENTIDTRIKDVYRPAFKPYKNSFCVGWTGGQSHRSDQLVAYKGLREFFGKHGDARGYFHVLCPQPLLSEFGAQIHFEPSTNAFLDYPGVAAAYPFDVCLVPLVNHPFNDAKSDLRLLDMAVNDIVLIASPRSDFIKHVERNFMLFADDDDSNYMSWAEAIEWAYAHPDELKEMAKRAREYVYAERHSEVAAAKWRDIFTKVI